MLDLSESAALPPRTPDLAASEPLRPLGEKLANLLRRRGLSPHHSMELAQAFAASHKSVHVAQAARRKPNGFVLVFLLSVMPLAVALAMSLGAVALMVGDRRSAMNSCRQELLKGLSKAAVPMQRILKLNSTAKALKIQEATLQVSLAAAVAAEDFVDAARITAQISEVESQRTELNSLQQTLYQQAQLELGFGQNSALQSIVRQKTWLKMTAVPFQSIQPAIRPVGPDLAPQWEEIPPFSETQTLEQKWQWSFQIRGIAEKFLHGSHRQEETCAATLDDSSETWQARLSVPHNQGKSF